MGRDDVRTIARNNRRHPELVKGSLCFSPYGSAMRIPRRRSAGLSRRFQAQRLGSEQRFA
jgi:hypothetical protein